MTFIRQGGQAVLTHQRADGTFARCSFPCQWPGSEGQTCSVRVYPDGKLHWVDGPDWAYTGPPDAPTLTPSINCQADQCWHGFIRNGQMVSG